MMERKRDIVFASSHVEHLRDIYFNNQRWFLYESVFIILGEDTLSHKFWENCDKLTLEMDDDDEFVDCDVLELVLLMRNDDFSLQINAEFFSFFYLVMFSNY